jgi:hypothetical protein
MLVLPVTIRDPRPAEMPHRTDIDELIEKKKQARIIEGFTIRENATTQLPFAFLAEINIDNDRLWDLFVQLAATLPDPVNCSYGLSSDEPVTSSRFSKASVLKILAPFREELVQDGFLSFGLLYLSRTEMADLMVTESKYIRFSGNDLKSFAECMVSFQLEQQERLDFIDEFPKIVEPLKKFLPESREPEQVVRLLDKAFRNAATA